MHPLAVAWAAYLHEYGLWAVFGMLLLENAGLPAPGESVLIAAGALAGRGRLGIVPVLLAAWAGAAGGSCAGYAIGRSGGRRLVVRYGRRVLVTDERLGRAERFFERYGGGVILGGRFVLGLRELSGIAAGTLKMPWRTFLAYNAAGAALWVGFWGVLAYEVSEDTEWMAAHWPWLVAAGALVAAAVTAVYVLRRRRGGNGPAQGVS